MAKDGGMSQYSGNKAGAAYGVGYCDAQCPRDLKFINGEVRFDCPTNRVYHAHSLYFRPTQKAGLLPQTVQTQARVSTDLAALKWTSGRRTPSQLL